MSGRYHSTMKQAYDAKGYEYPLTILSVAEAAAFREKYHGWVDSLPRQRLAGNARFKPHLFLPFVNDVVRNERLIRIVQNVLGTKDVLLWSSDFNTKPARSEGFFALHQDATYTGLSPAEEGVTVWLAVSDPVDAASGCLQFVEGSHAFGQLEHVEEERDEASNNLLSRNQRLSDAAVASLPNQVLVPAPLRAGQASLHHFHTVHASGPNRSAAPRIGLALRFIAATVEQTGPTREAATLVAGRCPGDSKFLLEPVLPPEGTATPEDIAKGTRAHADSLARETQNYFRLCADRRGYDEK